MDSTKTAVISGGLIVEKIAAFEPTHTFLSDTVAVLVTINANSSLNWIKAGYLLTGGFAAGGKLSEINSEVRLLRHEVVASNKIQDFRLDKLEAARK